MEAIIKHDKVSPEQFPELRDVYAAKLQALTAPEELTAILDRALTVIYPDAMAIFTDDGVLNLYFKLQDVTVMFCVEDCTRYIQGYEDDGRMINGFIAAQDESVTVAAAMDFPALPHLMREVIGKHNLTDVKVPNIHYRNLDMYQLFIKLADDLHIDISLVYDPSHPGVVSTAVN